MSLNNIFNMDSYGIYVWAAYGMTFLVFGIILFVTFAEKRQVNKMIKQL